MTDSRDSDQASQPSDASRHRDSRSVYRFAQFELDPVRESLHGPEGLVPLRDHALRVLKLLIERAPGIVSRDEILDGVWGHQALSESSIAQVIKDIRASLGDSAREPQLVATRYGRGYQFIGDIERGEREPATSADGPIPQAEAQPDSGAETESESPATTIAPTPARRPSGGVRMLVILAVALVAILGWQWFRGSPTVQVADAGPITLHAVAPQSGEALSDAFVDYLAFLLGNAIGPDRVDVARDDSDVETAERLIEISLASLESGDQRQLELAIGYPTDADDRFRLQFDEASELVRRGLQEVLDSIEYQADAELRIEAGLVSQSSFAVETLLRGMAAQFAGDVQRAAELFEAALAEDPDFEFARYELAIAVRRSGEYERALAIIEPMIQRLDSDFWTHRLNTAAGIAYWRMDRFDEALDAMRRAEAVSDSDATRAIILGNISLVERNLGELDQAEASAREAARLAAESNSTRLEASARNTLASILMRLDETDEAIVQLGMARELFYDFGDLDGYGAVLSRTAGIHDRKGERAEAESLLRLALGVRQQIGDEDGIADIQLRLARLHRVNGEFDQARELARSGLGRAQALEIDDLVIDGYQSLASLALAERRFDQARLYGSESLRLAELTGRDSDQRVIHHGLLELDYLTGDLSYDEIAARLDELLAQADAEGHRLVQIRARLLNAELYRAQARFDDARRVLDRVGEIMDEDDLRLRYEYESEKARLAMSRGDLDSADRAIAVLEQNNAPAHPTLMLRARLEAERGNPKTAVETAGLARSTIGDWWSQDDQALLDAWSAEMSSK